VYRQGAKDLDQFKDRRQFKRTDMAQQGVAVFADGTRVPCIIHDMSDPDAEKGFGMRVELINVPNSKVPHSFQVHLPSGRVIQYSPGWAEAL